MSAVALRCDADADRMLAHLRERFAEVFPVTGSAGDGAGGDAGGKDSRILSSLCQTFLAP